MIFMDTFIKIISDWVCMLKYSMRYGSNDFAVLVQSMYFGSQIYNILHFQPLKGFWNIHKCVYHDMCNDGHSGNMHAFPHIRSKYCPLGLKHKYIYFDTKNIFVLKYKYVCSEMKIYLLWNTNIFNLDWKIFDLNYQCICGVFICWKESDSLWLTPPREVN